MQRALAGSALGALIGLLFCAVVAAEETPKNVLTPISHTLPKAEVGMDDPPYHVNFSDTYKGQPWARGFYGCNTTTLGRTDLPTFNDCAKLPPGLSFIDYGGCSNSGNGCQVLYGVPTKAGTYSFRVAASDGQGLLIVRTYTLVVEEAKRFDLHLTFDGNDRSPGNTESRFVLTNNSGTTSDPTTLTFKTKLSPSGKPVTWEAKRLIVAGSNDECNGLVCKVPAMKPHARQTFVLNSTLKDAAAGEGGTYVRVRADIPCDEKKEASCDNNGFPSGNGTYERVTVSGR